MVALLKLLHVKRTQLNSSPLLLRFFSTSPKKTPILGARSTTMRPRGTSVSDEQDVKKVPIRKKRLKILKTAEKRERGKVFLASLFQAWFVSSLSLSSPSARPSVPDYPPISAWIFSFSRRTNLARLWWGQCCHTTAVYFSLYHHYYVRFLYSVWPTTCHSVTHFCPAQFTSWNVTFLLLAPLKESTHRK